MLKKVQKVQEVREVRKGKRTYSMLTHPWLPPGELPHLLHLPNPLGTAHRFYQRSQGS